MKRSRIIALRITILALVTTLSFVGSSTDEGSGTWLRVYEGEDYGVFFDITLIGDDHVLVTGASFHSQTATTLGDVLVAKLTMEGDIVWEKTYGGEAYDQGLYLEKTTDGGYLILGETESMGAGGRDLYLLQIDAQGEFLWEETYGGAGTEWAKDMIALADGGFLLIGETDSFSESFDVYVIRLDVDGTELWSTTLDTGRNESGTAALEPPNGDLLVLAVISYSGGSAGLYRDSRLYRLDSEGNELWTALYRGEHKQAGDAMAWTTDGDIVIAGLSELSTYTTAVFDFWLARVDAETGELQWSLIEGSQYADDYGISMSADIDGSFLVAGLGPGFPVLEFDETGVVAWLRMVAPDLGIYSGFAVLGLRDGSYMIPGFKYLQRAGDAFDAMLLRYSGTNAP
ncbi:MAG: PQQ-binding-like beta-propeller repeat protein [Candidatus Bipolaricaulota bacterium]